MMEQRFRPRGRVFLDGARLIEPREGIEGFLTRVIGQDAPDTEKNKVRVRIGGEEFTIVSAESEDYIRQIAARVDGKITGLTKEGRVPFSAAAVLAACNLADEAAKAKADGDHMRAQIKAYADDISRLRSELSELRRENAPRRKTER
jgi:cell division protein ZapA